MVQGSSLSIPKARSKQLIGRGAVGKTSTAGIEDCETSEVSAEVAVKRNMELDGNESPSWTWGCDDKREVRLYVAELGSECWDSENNHTNSDFLGAEDKQRP